MSATVGSTRQSIGQCRKLLCQSMRNYHTQHGITKNALSLRMSSMFNRQLPLSFEQFRMHHTNNHNHNQCNGLFCENHRSFCTNNIKNEESNNDNENGNENETDELENTWDELLNQERGSVSTIDLENIRNKLSTPLPNDGQPRMLISFICEKCGTRTSKVCRKLSYYKGIVIMQCQGEDKTGCMRWHLMADNMQWFSDDQFLVDDLMKKYGHDHAQLRERVRQLLTQKFDKQDQENDQSNSGSGSA